MRSFSYVISLCLHILFFLLLFYWPKGPMLRPMPPAVMISLVEGEMGGSKLPSNILGHTGEPSEAELSPSAPAPQKQVAAAAKQEVRETEKIPTKQEAAKEIKQQEQAPKEQKEVEVKPKETKPKETKPKPEAKPVEKPKPKPKPAEKPKPKPAEKPKEKPKGKEKETKRPQRGKGESADPVAAALRQARRDASSRVSGEQGDAVERALADARRKGSGTRGGGGGEGRGPGGGGLNAVYLAQVMLAVRPNWGYATTNRQNLSCLINIKVDMQGKVQEAKIINSSGNAQFDSSCVNAIWRTSNGGTFPPPPSREFMDLDVNFSRNELMGR